MISVSVNEIGVVSASIYNDEDGSVHRISLSPGASLDGVPSEIRDVATSAWTPEVLASFVESQQQANTPDTPSSVSARQIRLWLIQHGVSLESVDAAIDAIADSSARDSVKVEWEYAPYVERSHPMLVPLAAALGMTEAQIDAAFREAAML